MIFFFSKNIKVSGLFVRMLHVISPNYHKMPAWTGIVHLLPAAADAQTRDPQAPCPGEAGRLCPGAPVRLF